jgi:hypothetical protein
LAEKRRGIKEKQPAPARLLTLALSPVTPSKFIPQPPQTCSPTALHGIASSIAFHALHPYQHPTSDQSIVNSLFNSPAGRWRYDISSAPLPSDHLFIHII